jgi:hypothetical protein
MMIKEIMVLGEEESQTTLSRKWKEVVSHVQYGWVRSEKMKSKTDYRSY